MERRSFITVLISGLVVPVSGCTYNEDSENAILKEITLINKTGENIIITLQINHDSERVYSSNIQISTSERPPVLSGGWTKEAGEYNIIVSKRNSDAQEKISIKSGGCTSLIAEIEEEDISFFSHSEEESC
ncbi:hypothetical protein [Halorhabdus rudnickae]|uniref:hypothetical protein n=1 Tax=Halorhabdus rudnickae TaxID=1775544 RepID=UPI0010829DD6|nr:hypothetical protein [Halorhabdus rudnickae]